MASRSKLRFSIFGLVAIVASALLFANVRLINPGNGNPLFWPTTAVSIVINSTGSDDILDGSHTPAIRNAIDEWNSVSDTTLSLVEDTSRASQARTDFASTAIHLVMFDETNASGFFPGGSGTVAITPIWFFANGQISDADILFNGSGFTFGTDGTGFDVQDVVTHEMGHLLGFDHTAAAGATMFPFVDPSVILHRSIAVDEANGLREAYPAVTPAAVSGTVKRTSDSSTVAGAHVGVWDALGRSAGNALTNSAGGFALTGLAAGTYTLYTTPFEGPADVSNLGGGHTVLTDFESTVHGTVVVATGTTTSVGDIFVGSDVSITFGRSTDIFPKRVVIDDTTNVTIRGTGLTGATLTASDPALTLTPLLQTSSLITFSVTVPGGATVGHVDLMVDGAGDLSLLPMGLEVTPADPLVTSVSPAQADFAGGTTLTIAGDEFGPGSRVVIGQNVYVDGEVGGCTVVDRNTITLTASATTAGTYDVVVLDATGVEGRLSSGLQFLTLPVIDSVFPSTGAAAGGTPLVVTGENFLSGIVVTINSVTQSSVTLDSSTQISIVADSGLAGGPYILEVRNISGAVANSAFSFVAAADPVVSMVTPATGPAAGGSTITLTGTDFTATTDVVFGADPLTGLGGTSATSVTFIDANTLEAETPAHTGGLFSIIALEQTTGQASVMTAAFTFEGATTGGGGGGGGGCQARPSSNSLGDILNGLFGVLVAFAFLRWRLRVLAG